MEKEMRVKLIRLICAMCLVGAVHVALGLLLMWLSDTLTSTFLGSENITLTLPFIVAFGGYFLTIRKFLTTNVGQRLPLILIALMSFFAACFSAYLHYASIVSIWGS